MAESTTQEPDNAVIENLTVPPTPPAPNPEPPKSNTVTVSLDEWKKMQEEAQSAKQSQTTLLSKIKSVLLEGTEGREQQAHADLKDLLLESGLTDEQADEHAATLLNLGQEEEQSEESEEEEPTVANQVNPEIQNAIAAQAYRAVTEAVKSAMSGNGAFKKVLDWKKAQGHSDDQIQEWQTTMTKRLLQTVQQSRLKHDQRYGPSTSLMPETLDSIVGEGLKSLERELTLAFGTPDNLGRVPGAVKEDPSELIKKKPKPKPVSERPFEEVLNSGGRNTVNLEVMDDAIARIFAEEQSNN